MAILTKSEALVYQALVTWCRQHPEQSPSLQDLHAATGLSVPMVSDYLAALAKHGKITRTRNGRQLRLTITALTCPVCEQPVPPASVVRAPQSVQQRLTSLEQRVEALEAHA